MTEKDLNQLGYNRNYFDSWNTMTFENDKGEEVVIVDDFDRGQCQKTGLWFKNIEELKLILNKKK